MFDQLDAGQGKNILFGYGDGNGAHFNAVPADVLDKLENLYASDFEEDLQKTDAAEHLYAAILSAGIKRWVWNQHACTVLENPLRHCAECTGYSTANFTAWFSSYM